MQPDANVAGGGVMYKLLTKAFPAYYTGNSVYAMYPFTIPSGELGMMQALEELGQGGDFDDSRPAYKPLFSAHITSFDGVTKVLGDHDNFKVPCSSSKLLVNDRDTNSDGRGSTYQADHQPRGHAGRRCTG